MRKRGAEPDQQRVAPAVEQAHHHVAAVVVGPEEVLGPARWGRSGSRRGETTFFFLPSTVICPVRLLDSGVVLATLSAHTGAATQAATSSTKSAPNSERRPVAPQAAHGQAPGADAVHVLPLGLLLPGCRPLQCLIGCRLGGHAMLPSECTLPQREGAHGALPPGRLSRLLQAESRVVELVERVDHAQFSKSIRSERCSASLALPDGTMYAPSISLLVGLGPLVRHRLELGLLLELLVGAGDLGIVRCPRS